MLPCNNSNQLTTLTQTNACYLSWALFQPTWKKAGFTFSVFFNLNKMCLWNTMPPIMANSNEGQDHKDKYFDTSRKILSQEMTMCNMEALVSYPYKLWPMSIFKKKLDKCQGQKITYLQKDLITRDIHVKYQSSSTHYSKVLSNIKVF